jgi:hypothetical protein
MEPFTLLSALSGYTQKIGLVCTASTSFEQPYSLARKFATLDIPALFVHQLNPFPSKLKYNVLLMS